MRIFAPGNVSECVQGVLMGNGTGAARHGAVFLALMAMAAGQAAAQVYSIALPDIHNKRLSASPNRVTAGGTVEIRNAVQNLGAGALTPAHGLAEEGPTLTIRFVLVRNVKDSGGVELGSWSVDALERKEVKWHTASWAVPGTLTAGTYFLCADIDPANSVRESNELNNRTCLPLTVEAAPETAAGEDGEPLPEPGGDPESPEENF